MNDTMDSAKNLIDSAKGETKHVVSSARSSLFDGIHAAASVYSMLRGIGVGDALGWVGLARRRSPLGSMALFGAGFVAGAGAGVLFAPMSGADMRRAILDRFNSLGADAKRTIEKAEAGAKELQDKAETVVVKAKDSVMSAEQKVEDLAGKAKDAVVSAEQKVESRVASGLETAKNKAESAVATVKEAVDEGKSILTSAAPIHTAQRGGASGKQDTGNHRTS